MNYDDSIKLKLTKFRTWLVMGSEINWDTAISQPLPIWGLKDRYLGEFSLECWEEVVGYAIDELKIEEVDRIASI